MKSPGRSIGHSRDYQPRTQRSTATKRKKKGYSLNLFGR